MSHPGSTISTKHQEKQGGTTMRINARTNSSAATAVRPSAILTDLILVAAALIWVFG